MTNTQRTSSVVETNNPSSLKLRFDCGLDEHGKTIVKSRSFSNIKHNALGLDVYNIAKALESLQQHSLLSVIKQDNTEISA